MGEAAGQTSEHGRRGRAWTILGCVLLVPAVFGFVVALNVGFGRDEPVLSALVWATAVAVGAGIGALLRPMWKKRSASDTARSRKLVVFLVVAHAVGLSIMIGVIVPVFFAAIKYQSVQIWSLFGLAGAALLYNTLGVAYYGRTLRHWPQGRRRDERPISCQLSPED